MPKKSDSCSGGPLQRGAPCHGIIGIMVNPPLDLRLRGFPYSRSLTGGIIREILRLRKCELRFLKFQYEQFVIFAAVSCPNFPSFVRCCFPGLRVRAGQHAGRLLVAAATVLPGGVREIRLQATRLRSALCSSRCCRGRGHFDVCRRCLSVHGRGTSGLPAPDDQRLRCRKCFQQFDDVASTCDVPSDGLR